jgi:acyl-CoA synthetase (AMP-forming)/AMP-acid ligase II
VLVAMNVRLSPAEVGYISRTRRRGSLEPLAWEVADEQAAISINYTSGTTGEPKGVLYIHRGAHLNSLGEVIHSEHSSSSVYLWTLPMFHCNGWCTTWRVTAIGGTHVCLRAVRPDVIWRLIDEEGVTHMNGAPAVMTAITRAPESHRLTRPLTVTTAGAAPSPTMIAELEALGARVIHVYGLTEVYGPYSLCAWQPDWPELDPSERARKLARQGVGMVAAERLRVVDGDMNDVPADGETIGEIAMRGNDVMKGYFGDPEATALAFTGGWFHSADLGVMHPGRLRRAGGPGRGHRDLGRREHLDGGGEADAPEPSGRGRGRGHPNPE